MTTSKFHEHLDFTASPTTFSPHPDVVDPILPSRKSSSATRFPIDLGATPQRNSSRKSLKKHTARKSSGDSSSSTSSTGTQNTSNAFAGPDADFDFGGRPAVQRLEPTNPSEQERMQQLEKEQHVRDQYERRRSGQVRNRLRKLSLSAR